MYKYLQNKSNKILVNLAVWFLFAILLYLMITFDDEDLNFVLKFKLVISLQLLFVIPIYVNNLYILPFLDKS
jgi:hypothetical protein